MKEYYEKCEALTDVEVSLLKSSFRRINSESFSNQFYNSLFDNHPRLRKLFPAEIGDIKLKLMSVIELIAFSFKNIEVGKNYLEPGVLLPLVRLGRNHTEYGVQKEHYTIAADLFIKTLQAQVENCTDEIVRAWSLSFKHITFLMTNTTADLSGEEKSLIKTSVKYLKDFIKGKG